MKIQLTALVLLVSVTGANAEGDPQNCEANPSQPFCSGEPGPPGPQGPIGPAGPQGEQGAAGLNGLDGKDGVDGKDGRDGRDFESDEALAIGAALSMPGWLEPDENFSISGGVGFGESSAAFGATGIMRIDGGVSGFVGAAVGENGAWAGKAGIRAGW